MAHEFALGAFELATHYGMLKYQALVRRLLAEVAAERGDLDTAAHELELALGVLGGSPIPLIGWKLEASLACIRQAQDQPAAALAALERAAAVRDTIAEQVGDLAVRARFLEMSRRELEEGLAAVPPRAVAPADDSRSAEAPCWGSSRFPRQAASKTPS